MSGEPLAAVAGVAGAVWPVAATIAAVYLRDRRRDARRRRRLNERLHELRRPLQALVLAAPRRDADGLDPLALALAALRDLDREVNGAPAELRRAPVEARMVALAAVERWRVRAAARGRALELRWRAGDELAHVDPARTAQALDNLIANALEHGRGPVTLEGTRRGGRIEIAVRDGGAFRRARRLRDAPDPRRGHGLRVTRELTRRQGGALRIRAGRRGTTAALELPLVPRGRRAPAPAPRERDPHRV